MPNYVPTSERGSLKLSVSLPCKAKKPIAVLAQNAIDFQDNVFDTKAYQYWGEIDATGTVTIPRVKAGTYRLTIYAEGVFGDFVQDDIVVAAGKERRISVKWREESAGSEIFRYVMSSGPLARLGLCAFCFFLPLSLPPQGLGKSCLFIQCKQME